MMDLIENQLKKEENYQLTEKGAIGYKSTGKALVDLNYSVSSLRNASEDEIIRLFDAAFHENKEYCLRWLFFARDIREGLGERRLFRVCYRRLVDLDVDLFKDNLVNISEYGRWDDLISLLGISDVTDEFVLDLVDIQLANDIERKDNGESISLLTKWLPSENASSKETKKLACKIRKGLGLSSKEYRVILSNLRKYLDVVEVKMCSNQWESIDYERVPSLANLKYKDAFLRHDMDRRISYLESLKKGNVNMNMNVATPVDIVSKYKVRIWDEQHDVDDVLELAWDNLKDINIEDTLVVADGSGSMTRPVSGKITALNVANALAIYSSEHNNSVYKNKYITFSSKPQLVEFNSDDSLCDKLLTCNMHNEISNTDIEAVFKLILGVAVENNLPREDMVKNVLIISDMEFDEAQKGWGRYKLLTQSLFDEIKDYYNEIGYDLPKLIFWNVNSRTRTIPILENDLGVTLVSGFSQNVLKMVMSNKYNPYDVLVEMITSKRYDKIIME